MLSQLGTVFKGKRAAAAMGLGVMAGFGASDPVEHTIATFEDSVMGDPNYSERLLGRQMGGYGLLAGLGPIGPSPVGFSHAVQGMGGAIARGSYTGGTMLSNAALHKTHSTNTPPGSMVFGMFNSRMN
jgi:hypothetical protein